MPSETCYYCDRPAEYLCDFVLEWGSHSKAVSGAIRDGRELGNEEWMKAIQSPDAVLFRTCDRPLCEVHRHNRGHAFYCSNTGEYDRNGKSLGTCEVVTQDFCPGHAQGPDSKPRYNPIGGGKAG